MTTYEFSQFHFDRDKMVLTADASTLGWKPGQYPKALDIHGKSTVTFELAGELSDQDGDIVQWMYLPRERGGRFLVVVYND